MKRSRLRTRPLLNEIDQTLRVTMADEDEELSHLRASDAADHDPTEEAQDFRGLDKLMFVLSSYEKLSRS
jgi:hypothetical protein